MSTRESAIVVDDQGQFDDAEQDFTFVDVPIQAWTIPAAPAPVVHSALDFAPAFDPRQGRQLIDDDAERNLLEWSSSSDSDEEADELDENDFFDDIQVDDEDWEVSERGAQLCIMYPCTLIACFQTSRSSTTV